MNLVFVEVDERLEEWLLVIEGAPVLREPAGERTLAPGDVVCFPNGRLGSHTVKGPGRFVIFATGHHVEPWMSVYPDSAKVSGPEGILRRSSAVGYWHGEGTAGSQPPDEVTRNDDSPPPRPVVNVSALSLDVPDPPAPVGSRFRASELGPLLEADRLGATVVELDPREGSEPYHYVHGREEWLLILAGAPTLRHPYGEDRLDAGDLLCLPEGPAGARRLSNRGESVVRALFLSTTALPVNVCYPDSGHWLMQNGPGPDEDRSPRTPPSRVKSRGAARAGERADIEPGVWHDWWNEGAVPAVVRVEVTPGERFVHMLETLFGLARGGYVNARGMPARCNSRSPRRSSPTCSSFASRRLPSSASRSVRSRPSPAAAAIARRTRRCRARPSPHARRPTAQRAEADARRHAGSTHRNFATRQRTTSADAQAVALRARRGSAATG